MMQNELRTHDKRGHCDFEVDLSNLPAEMGGGFTKDCNGMEIGFDAAGAVLVQLESYSQSSLT